MALDALLTQTGRHKAFDAPSCAIDACSHYSPPA